MTAVILQARLDSSRLPRKALLPLDGEPLVLRAMEALSSIPADSRVLACPADSASDFGPLADRAGFRLVVGPKDDVLARYCGAIRAVGADLVIRATGDNPFVFPDAAAEIALQARALRSDYASFAGLPYGAGVEAVSAEALLRAEREAEAPAEREHVCPYLYGHPELFSLHRPLCPPLWRAPECRVTVDTREDYERAQRLMRELSGAVPDGERVIAAYRRVFPLEGGAAR